MNSGSPCFLSMRRKDWWSLVCLFALAIGLNFWGLNLYHLFDPSEGFYAEAGREMVETGNYIVPHLNYRPWFDKPILIYWLISACYKVLGVSEYASRIPSAIAAEVLAVSLFITARYFLPLRTAIISVLVLLSFPLFLIISHVAMTDMVFGCLTSLAIMSLFITEENGPPSFRWIGYCSLGLALLCKGPLAIVILFLVFGSYFFIQYRSPSEIIRAVRKLQPVSGLILVLLIAIPWYFLVHVATDGAFTTDFFIHQNLGRLGQFHESGAVRFNEPFWYYVPVLFAGLFPWSLNLFSTALIFKRRFFSVPERSRRFLLFCACWASTTFIFFSLVTSKLPTYVIHTMPPLAVITGVGLDLIARIRDGRRFLVSGVLSTIAIVCFVFFIVHSLGATPMANQIAPLSTLCMIGAMSQVLYSLFLCLNKSALAVRTLLVGTIFAVGLGVPIFMRTTNGNLQPGLSEVLSPVKNDTRPIGSYFREVPVASFYLHKRIPAIVNPLALDSFLLENQPGECLLLSRVAINDQIRAKYKRFELISQKGKWYLYSVAYR